MRRVYVKSALLTVIFYVSTPIRRIGVYQLTFWLCVGRSVGGRAIAGTARSSEASPLTGRGTGASTAHQDGYAVHSPSGEYIRDTNSNFR